MGTTATTGIRWLHFAKGSIYDEIGIDNISYTIVPIPGAVWLLGSGLLGLVAIRRRKGKE